jgi:hypothetical protein
MTRHIRIGILLAALLTGCVCPEVPDAPPGYFYCQKCNAFFPRKSVQDVWDHLTTHYYEDALRPKPKRLSRTRF